MTFRRAALAELRFVPRVATERTLWLLVALVLVACVAAYGRPFHYVLDVGGDRRSYDEPYLLGGFNDGRERQSELAPAFRWAFGDARVVFPGVGASARALTMRVVSGQPQAFVASAWQFGDRPLIAVPLAQGGRSYHALVPGGMDDFDLRVQTPTFTAPGDSRSLAFALDELAVASFGATYPPPIVALWSVLVVVVGYALVRRWQIPARPTFVVGSAGVAAFGLSLAFGRLGLTTYLPRLAVLLIAAYGVTLLLFALLPALARLVGNVASAREVHGITALIVLAWLIRLGALLHPQANTNDLGLHANNLRGVMRGAIIFTENLPGEAGGGPAPYPPGQYVMLLPFGGLADAGIVLQIGTTLAESLTIAWGWLLLRAAGANAGAALWAGALYLFALPLLWSSLVGEVANVWGQALVAPMMLVLWRWQYADQPATMRGWVTLGAVPAAAILVALLGHFGVFLSLVVFFAAYVATLLVLRGPWLRVAVLLAVCGVASVVLYYSAHLAILLQSPERAAMPFGFGRIGGQLGKALGVAGLLGPIVPAIGAVGLAIIAVRLPRLRAIMLAWWAGTLLSLAPLLWTEQALRWTLFVFPAMAWTGGVALDALAARGRWGRVVAYALVAVLVVWGAVLWYRQIISYNH